MYQGAECLKVSSDFRVPSVPCSYGFRVLSVHGCLVFWVPSVPKPLRVPSVPEFLLVLGCLVFSGCLVVSGCPVFSGCLVVSGCLVFQGA